MKNTLGNNIQVTIFGESHGDSVGVVLNGVSPGVFVDEDFIKKQMGKRKAHGSLATQRQEMDEVEIISGVFNGYTTGAPCCFLIKNHYQESKDYDKVKDIARPSHVDYVANERYYGFQDYRGGGHFSGRLTAPLVAAGALALSVLEKKGIQIGSHIVRLHQHHDDHFSKNKEEIVGQLRHVKDQGFPVLNEDKKKIFEECIQQAKQNQDSVGGVLETMIFNLPIGVGEPFFDSLESRLAHAVFSVGGVKGVEFGLGFSFGNQYGSEVSDEMSVVDNCVETTSNHNGGILGGLSTGMPVLMKTVIKPTSSIGKAQKTINMKTKENIELTIEGRHDPAIIYRTSVVIDSMVALVVWDCLMDFYKDKEFIGDR